MMNRMLFIIVILFSSVNFISTTTYSCDPTISCGCSTSSTIVTSRIVGGEIASNHAWGWMVSFQQYEQHKCGASLLTPEYAVTGAHCVEDFLDQISSLSILVGTNYLNDISNTTAQRRSIINIIMHPNYDFDFHINDIAILQFSPLNITSESNLAVICLPDANVDPFELDSDLIALGWGYLSSYIQIVSNELRQVTVQVASSTSTACIDGGLTDSNSQFCAGVVAGGKDTCQGDSGGPLMAFVNNTWILAGITSLGIGCAEPGYVAVYTRVSSFISFINSNINFTVSDTTTVVIATQSNYTMPEISTVTVTTQPNNIGSETTTVTQTAKLNYTESITMRNEAHIINRSILIFVFLFSFLTFFFCNY